MRNINFLLILLVTTLFVTSSYSQVQTNNYVKLLQQFLPAELRGQNITLDRVREVLKKKCTIALGSKNDTLVAEIEQESTKFMACISKLGNSEDLKKEMELATPIGELDTVFEKYCDKKPQAEKCLMAFNQKIQPCLTANEKKHTVILFRIIKGMTGFLCSQGGGPLALFISEDGPECMEANKEAVAQCANSSFAEYLKSNKTNDIFGLTELVLEPQHCIDVDRFKSCAIHHLEQCRESTPANIIESVFKFIKNETNCDELMKKSGKQRSVFKSGATNLLPQLAFLTILIMFILSVLR